MQTLQQRETTEVVEEVAVEEVLQELEPVELDRVAGGLAFPFIQT